MLMVFLSLTACKGNGNEGSILNNKEDPLVNSEEKTSLNLALESEEDILKYLTGQWDYKSLSFSIKEGCLEIDKDLKFFFSIYDPKEDTSQDYQGRIKILPHEAIIRFETNQESYDYDFKHMTYYDGKYLMGLFHSGESNHLFEVLAGEYERNTIDEIYFERETDIKYSSSPKKKSKFNGIIWGYEWVDDSDKYWIGEVDEDFRVTDGISKLYGFSPDLDDDRLAIYHDDIFTGYAYQFETDEDGNIVSLSMEGYHHLLTGAQPLGKADFWTDRDNLVEIRREGHDYFLYYPLDNWEEVYRISFYEGELYLKDELMQEEVPILGLGGQVKDIAINMVSDLDQTTDEYIQPIVFFLMEDGSVEWLPGFPVATEGPYNSEELGIVEFSRGKLPWIKDIENLFVVETSEEGEVLYGRGKNGKRSKLMDSYNLSQLLHGGWEYPDYEEESDYHINKVSFSDDGLFRLMKRNILDDVELIYEGSYDIAMEDDSYQGYKGPNLVLDLKLIRNTSGSSAGIKKHISGIYGLESRYYGGVDFQLLEGDFFIVDKKTFQLARGSDYDSEEFSLWGLDRDEFTDYLLNAIPTLRGLLKRTGLTILIDGSFTTLQDYGECRDLYIGKGTYGSFNKEYYYTVTSQGHIYEYSFIDDIFYLVYDNSQ